MARDVAADVAVLVGSMCCLQELLCAQQCAPVRRRIIVCVRSQRPSLGNPNLCKKVDTREQSGFTTW